ncbi:MAG: glycosyltransferase family 4 protein [bacterium]|nr:glycosyltransferase family 4 protein [bacterium]
MDKNNNNYRIKVLVLCQLFYPELVSTGQTLTELCEELVKLGVEIEVICGPVTILKKQNKIPKYLEYQGIRIHRVWGTRFPKLHLWGRIINQITYASSTFIKLLCDFSKRPILVLTNPPFLAVSCAILKSIGLGKPYIYLIFDVYPDSAINLGVLKKDSFVAKLWEWFNKFTYRHATAIVVIGRCMEEVIIKKFEQHGLKDRDKIHRIHIWSDDRLIQQAFGKPNPYIDQWKLKDKFVISYSGNMGRYHDLETIMAVVKELQVYPDIEFLFIGEGHYKQWMQQFAQDNHLTNCQFHTYVERAQLGFSLSCAHLGLVSLARGQEGLSVPSKTFGYLAAGVPVIAIMSAKSEIAKVIQEENCGVVVEPGDKVGLLNAILSLYNNQVRLNEMRYNARYAIEKKYNLITAVQAYHTLLSNVTKRTFIK